MFVTTYLRKSSKDLADLGTDVENILEECTGYIFFNSARTDSRMTASIYKKY